MWPFKLKASISYVIKGRLVGVLVVGIRGVMPED